MIISPVIIKGNKMGIRLIIAPEATLDLIIHELREKLQTTKQYYHNIRPISVTFEGKLLTEEETNIILDALREIGLNIQTKSSIDKHAEEQHNPQPEKDGLFYIGCLRNGQTLNAAESIVIVGDIEQGAEVYSEGNIVIIGELNGYAEAGCKGRQDAFVYSLISGRNSK